MQNLWTFNAQILNKYYIFRYKGEVWTLFSKSLVQPCMFYFIFDVQFSLPWMEVILEHHCHICLCKFYYIYFSSSGLRSAFWWQKLLWSWRFAILWNSLPCKERVTMCQLSETNHRKMYYCHVQEISPRTFCLCILFETVKQRHI